MNDRGEYRAIRRVLLDGPDFQKLSTRARFTFLVLKLNLGPAGIEVRYPDSLASQIGAQTGLTVPHVQLALSELEESGWIRREANVIWVVGQLEHDPFMQASDSKHCKAIQRHLHSLPRLSIVRQFIEAHPAWYASYQGDPVEGMPAATPAPAPKTTPSKNGAHPEAKAHRLPGSWAPNDGHLVLARSRNVDVQLEADKMRDWAASKGEKRVDWDRAFSGWLRRAEPTRNGRPGKRPLDQQEYTPTETFSGFNG